MAIISIEEVKTRTIKTMEQLKALAIEMTDGIEIYRSKSMETELLTLKGMELDEKRKKFSDNDDAVVAFVDENETMYVIPKISGVILTLGENGYTWKRFYVPLCKCDYPVGKKGEWELLWEEFSNE